MAEVALADALGAGDDGGADGDDVASVASVTGADGGGAAGEGVGDVRGAAAGRRGVPGVAPPPVPAAVGAGPVVAVAAYSWASVDPAGSPIAARPPLIARKAPATPPARSRVTPVTGTMRDGVGTGGPLGRNSSV